MATEGIHTFCWFELATSSTQGALPFYQKLFGWSAQPVPMPGMGDYILLNQGANAVGAMFEMTPETGLGHMPPNWASYVLVESADAAARRALELGAKQLKAPFDVADMGRMAILQDPAGAVFQVWQAKQNGSGAVIDYREKGRVCWCEHQSRDVKAASQFYAQLFGWRIGGKEGGDYVQFFCDESPLGGFFDLAKQPALANVPPCWILYFATDDVDASTRQVTELGGKVHMPPMDMQHVGRMSVVADPQGATFILFKLDEHH